MFGLSHPDRWRIIVKVKTWLSYIIWRPVPLKHSLMEERSITTPGSILRVMCDPFHTGLLLLSEQYRSSVTVSHTLFAGCQHGSHADLRVSPCSTIMGCASQWPCLSTQEQLWCSPTRWASSDLIKLYCPCLHVQSKEMAEFCLTPSVARWWPTMVWPWPY